MPTPEPSPSPACRSAPAQPGDAGDRCHPAAAPWLLQTLPILVFTWQLLGKAGGTAAHCEEPPNSTRSAGVPGAPWSHLSLQRGQEVKGSVCSQRWVLRASHPRTV